MDKNSKQKKTEEAEIQMENQDLPNIPASTEKIKEGEKFKEEIKKTSKLHNEGKTDNTEKNA